MFRRTGSITICAVALFACVFFVAPVSAQQPGVVVTVKTDRPDAIYSCNEQAAFIISATQDGQPITEGEVTVTFTRDLGERLDRKKIQLGKVPARVTATLAEPGFLHCEAAFMKDGKVLKTLAAAGFDPKRIKPVCTMPRDFDAFWKAGRAELAKIPLDVKLTPLPEYSDERQDAFKISFANIGNTRIYGFLNVPKKKTPPFPAWVHVPSAGLIKPTKPRPWYAPKGILYLDMCIHDFDPTNPPEGIKKRTGYTVIGAPDPNKYYFRRAILGLDRAIDYLASRPDFDKKHMVISGSSQGGGLSLIMAGLNKNITAASAGVPALCDQRAALVGRSATWPRMCSKWRKPKDKWAAMSEYFDAVNFARKIKCPTIVYVGFIDTTCPPGAVYGAYNVITAPKYIFNGPLGGHGGGTKEWSRFQGKWIDGHLGLKPAVPFPDKTT